VYGTYTVLVDGGAVAASGVASAWAVWTVGRPAEDNRRFVNAVLWVVRSGMRWADMPERYGKYKSVHK